MDKGLPAPDWEANFLPERGRSVMVLMLMIYHDLTCSKSIIPILMCLIESFEHLQVVLLDQSVLDPQNALIVHQKTVKDFILRVLNRIVSDI